MRNGTVQWFDRSKGFGLVELPDATTAFVHRTTIPGSGYLYLVKGEPVQVELEAGDAGRLNVTALQFPSIRRSGHVRSFDKGYGYIVDEADGGEYFFHHSNVLRAYGRVDMEQGELVYFYKGDQDGRSQAKYVKKADPRTPFDRFAAIPDDAYEALAALAEPEDWSLSHEDAGGVLRRDGLRLLRNYVKYTFLRLVEEDKIAAGTNSDGDPVASFNTGLVTPRQQEIYALFRGQRPGALTDWQFTDWVRDSDTRVSGGVFEKRPRLATYWTDPSDLFFDPSLPVVLDTEHFVDDNLERYPDMFRANPMFAVAATTAAKDQAVARARRNYKTAVPMYHKGEVQLLLPLSLDGSGTAQLALLVRRVGNEYLGETVLTLSQALNNARLLSRPDRDWLKE
jgi:cold shock CspA family protein